MPLVESPQRKKYKLIVGLGNPGLSYQGTRHNAGARAVELLARKNDLHFKSNRSFRSFVVSGKIKDRLVCLALPQTFMNLSGEAVVRLARKKNIALKDLLIVCDDVALTLGRLKIKPKGSAGGHNGLSSIIEKLGSDAFPRLRCGIAREGGRGDLADFVLSVFDREEKPFVQTMLVQAVEAMESWLVEGIEKCMGRYNGKNK